jgi:hypothetical protein
MSGRTDREHDVNPDPTPADDTGYRDQSYRNEDYQNDEGPSRFDRLRQERFRGINWGAAFFGWLVAIAVAVLLTSIVGAVAAAVGTNTQVTQSSAERQAGTIGIVAAVILLVVLMIAYYAGGYVAGRMSRFDGGRQGLAVWLIGLLVTLIAVGLGLLFGSQYNIFDRVELPTLPVPQDALSWGGIITLVAVLLGTILAAMLGGKVGQRYHRKVDEAFGT